MEDKLKLPKVKQFDQNKDKVIRALITEQTLGELDKLSEETGLSMQQLTGKCITFALKHVDFVEF